MYQRRNPETGKREGNWYISIGATRISSGTSDKKKAQALEHKLNAEAWDRRNGFVIPTWEQACVEWMQSNPGPAGKEWVKRLLDFWKDRLKGKKIQDEITPKLIHGIAVESWKVDPTNPVPGNSTANQYVGFVKRIIRSTSNFNPKLITYPKTQGRDRWLTVEEWHKLVDAMNPDLLDVSLFGLATGLREANVMGLRWEWVKGDWALIPPEFTKTTKPYGIPLNLTAQTVLDRRRQATVRHPELVFLNSGKPWYRVSLCGAFRKAVGASGIAPVTPHGLRHTFASWLAQRGVSHTIRARLGCWSTGSMADHYSHFDVDSLRPFSEVIDQILAAAVKSQEKSSA